MLRERKKKTKEKRFLNNEKRVEYNKRVCRRKKVKKMIGCLIIHGYTGGHYEVKPLEDYLRTHSDWQISVPVLEGHGKQLHLVEVTYEEWLESTHETM